VIDPKQVCLFVPPDLKKFKLQLFEGIGQKILQHGGKVLRYDYEAVKKLPDEIIPIVGVSPQFRQNFQEWRERGRNFIYWDRGYLRRVFATWLPTGNELGVPGGYYRWHLNCFQAQGITERPPDRWERLKLHWHDYAVGVHTAFPWPWEREGEHIVIADTLPDYWDVFADRSWAQRTADELKQYTKRPIIIRRKEEPISLRNMLKKAHCLVTHGSIAAVEAVMMGCPVFVDSMSAAAAVGETDFSKIETPVYPDRMPWLYSLAYHQWNEAELVSNVLWEQIT